MTTTTTRGGPRPNAGRPTATPGSSKSQSVTLNEAQKAKAYRVGNGVIAAGVRLMIDAYVEPEQVGLRVPKR